MDLHHPVGYKFSTLSSIKSALGIMYDNTADKRYKEISQNFRHISDALRGPIPKCAEHEQNFANGVTVTISLEWNSQTDSVQKNLFEIGYRVSDLTRQCANNWFLRHLIMLKIMGMRNNSKRNRDQERKGNCAKKNKTIQDKTTRPKVGSVACLHAASSSTNQIEVFDCLENTPFLALRSHFRPMSETASEHLDLTSYQNLSNIGSRLASLNQDTTIPSFTDSNEADEALDAEHSSSSSVNDEEDEPPSIRNLHRNPLRTKAGAEFFENEVPQVKKKIRQSNKTLARERSKKTAAKKARNAELDRNRVILDTEIPTKHTVKCTAGWMWCIDIGNAYTSEHSPDTFECWKVRVPQKSDLVVEQVPVLIN